MNNIGAAMAGGKGGKRDKGDEFFPTPEGTTRALLPVLAEIGWPTEVWECSCGEGHISKQLHRAGYTVASTNLTDRGFGDTGVDFLETTHALAPSIITNPPFSLSDEFVVHARTVLGIEHIALLLPSGIWHAKNRVALFEMHTPSLILPCTWRIDVARKGSPTMNVSWYLWHPTHPTVRGYRPLLSNEKKPGVYDDAQ